MAVENPVIQMDRRARSLLFTLLATRCATLSLSRRAALATSGAALAGGGAPLVAPLAAVAAAAEIDAEYPGTALARMGAARARVRGVGEAGALAGEWEAARRALLWAGGLRDLRAARPGEGYTGHSFNDFNHCDLTCMLDGVRERDNADGAVAGVSSSNGLARGIVAASLPELGAGGSWSTCMIGCASAPPRDVAHVQFRSRVAFKLVWSAAADYSRFAIVDDAGLLLATGRPASADDGPPREERQANYALVRGSKYAVAADALRA